jgi:septal ring factor EnvC (AmiA/AmiB activator)
MGDPTGPTRPIGQPPQRSVAHGGETVFGPDEVLEEVHRVRFWSYFGSAVAVLGSVLALIALIVAMSNDDQAARDRTTPQLESLRQDIGDLRSEVSKSSSAAQDAADKVDSLSNRVKKLEQAGERSNVADDLSQLQQDVSDLSDRVDQVERAQEDAASGGP